MKRKPKNEYEQREAIKMLEREQDASVTTEDRRTYMQRILSTPRSLADAAPEPAPVKRGRKPKIWSIQK